MIIRNIEIKEIIVKVQNKVHHHLQVQEEEVHQMILEDIQEDQVEVLQEVEEVILSLIIREVKVEALDLFLLKV